jgi:hypothetical protein
MFGKPADSLEKGTEADDEYMVKLFLLRYPITIHYGPDILAFLKILRLIAEHGLQE